MTKQHILDYYMDGRERVEFCKVCSAEGKLELQKECSGKFKTDDPFSVANAINRKIIDKPS